MVEVIFLSFSVRAGQDLLHQFKESSKRATFFISTIPFVRALSPKSSICPDELSENLFFQVMVFLGGDSRMHRNDKKGRVIPDLIGPLLGHQKRLGKTQPFKVQRQSLLYSATQEHSP